MRVLLCTLLIAAAVAPGEAFSAPDLTASVKVTVSPVCDENDKVPVTFEITFCNNGDAPCKSSWFAHFFDFYSCPCTKLPQDCDVAATLDWDSKEFGNLSAGQCKTFVYETVRDPSESPIQYVAFADSFMNFCQPEVSEDNNLVCGSYSLPPECPKYPDITLVSASLENDEVFPSNVHCKAVVKNAGVAATDGPFSIDFYLNGEAQPDQVQSCDSPPFMIDGMCFATVDKFPLEPGEEVEAEGMAYDLPADSYHPIALANSFHEVDEGDVAACENNCLTMEPFVQPVFLDKPDLLVPEFESFLVGANVNFQGRVRNDGYVDVAPGSSFKVCVWYNHPGGQPSQCEMPDKQAGEGDFIEFMDGLAVNALLDFGAKVGAMDNGCYDFWARADCDCQIFETDEKNNDFKFTLCVDLPGPDCRIKMFTAHELQDDGCQSSVEYVVIVENVGSDPMPPAWVDVEFDSDEMPTLEQPPEWGKGWKLDDPLDPGQSIQLPYTLWSMPGGLPVGDYTAWAICDWTNEIPEINESNNVASIPAPVVGCQPGCPNVTIEEFTSGPVVGDVIPYRVVFKNNGEKDIPESQPFRVDIFKDRETIPGCGEVGDYQQVVAGLKAGEQREWVIEWEGVPREEAEYWSWVSSDSECALQECNEADNISGPRIAVVDPDAEACAEGVYLSMPCYCGNQTINYGYCCDGILFALGCPDQPDALEDSGPGEDVNGVVEFDPVLGAADSNCGCRVSDPPENTPSGVWILIAFAALIRLFAARPQGTLIAEKR